MKTIYESKPCEICGGSYEPTHHNQKTCSDDCRKKLNNENHRRSRERMRRGRFCKSCGKSLDGKPNRQVYCSYECQRGTATCENCGKNFVPTPKSAGRFCSSACFYDYEVPIGTERPSSGYTIVKVPRGTPGAKLQGMGRANWMWTHRYVMQQKLGRPLEKHERVHHLNGNKTDNRPENLELWQRSHPTGVRKVDAIKSEILELTLKHRKQLREWLNSLQED